MTAPTAVPPGTIALQVGAHVVLIDRADLELVSRYTWRVIRHPRTGKLYASATNSGTRIMMHRLIAQTPEGLDTDHRDGDGLNNCRSNLRPATRSQNNANRRKHSSHAGKPTTSQFKGVHWDREKRKWRATIRVNGKQKRLGRFDSEIEAAKAYDEALIAQWGEHARPNFAAEVSAP